MGEKVAELVRLVRQGDAGRLRQMLSVHPGLAWQDLSQNDERRALHIAVIERATECVRGLLEAGADPRQGVFPFRGATTPIVLAGDRGFGDLVEMMEAYPSAAVKHDTIPAKLETAILSDDADEVTRMLAEGGHWREISSDGGLLTFAVKHKAYLSARILPESGADVDERRTLTELEEPTESWGYPLWHAARLGDLRMAELLLVHGADPNGNVYASGWPLRNAWHHEDPAVKELLLRHGACMEPYLAAELGQVETARRLFAEDPGGNRAWELAVAAAEFGRPMILKEALQTMDPREQHRRWNWLVVQPIRGFEAGDAANTGRFQCFDLILAAGVSPDASRLGQTASHFVAGRRGVDDSSRCRYAERLLESGAQLQLRDELLESTALGWACRWEGWRW